MNGIKIETTSTRRAGLVRFTYPESATSRHVVVDLTHDLQRSFEGGTVNLNTSTGRVTLTGTFLQVMRCLLSSHARSHSSRVLTYRATEKTTTLLVLATTSMPRRPRMTRRSSPLGSTTVLPRHQLSLALLPIFLPNRSHSLRVQRLLRQEHFSRSILRQVPF